MGVFTFVCRSSSNEWSAKQISDGNIEACASSTFELQRKLVQSALSADSSGAVQSSFSYVTPSSAVFQVVIGGSTGGAFFGGGGGLVAAPAGGATAAAEAPAAAEKKKEEEPESDDDMGFSLLIKHVPSYYFLRRSSQWFTLMLQNFTRTG